MDYLTNYYKNLCEQRQEEIRLLEQQLVEGERWDKFKQYMGGELENLGNIGGALVKLPGAIADKATSGGLSRVVASTQRAVAGGLDAAARGLGKLSASAESGAQQSEARAREMDFPARAADQHLAEIQAAFQRRLPEIAQSAATDVEVFRNSHIHRAYSDRNWEQAKRGYEEPKLKVKKSATEEEKRAAWWAAKEKKEEAYRKSEKAADEAAGKEFDKLYAGNLFLGRLASHISRLSSQGEGNKPPRLPEGAPAIARYEGMGGPPARKASEVGTEVLTGGWSTFKPSDEHDFVLHPDVEKYNKWWESEGRERGAAHPNEIWHHGIEHVDERFEHLLDNIPREMMPKGMTSKKLKALNAGNRAAAAQAFQRANEEMTRLTTRGSEVPVKMMESKKVFLNNKIKNLMESASSYGSRLPENYGAGSYVAGQRMQGPTHLPFEILHVSAPMAYTDPHMYNLAGHDDSLVAIYGRHVRPDGSRGPELVIHPHAFHGIGRDTILDHAFEMIMGKGKVSKGNILHQAWNGQGGDNPTTLLVDPTKVETQQEYNDRIKDLGF